MSFLLPLPIVLILFIFLILNIWKASVKIHCIQIFLMWVETLAYCINQSHLYYDFCCNRGTLGSDVKSPICLAGVLYVCFLTKNWNFRAQKRNIKLMCFSTVSFTACGTLTSWKQKKAVFSVDAIKGSCWPSVSEVLLLSLERSIFVLTTFSVFETRLDLQGVSLTVNLCDW